MERTIKQALKPSNKKNYFSDTLVGLVPKNINEKIEKMKRVVGK
jgi:hypothetical protein